jgi:hypothetical protein
MFFLGYLEAEFFEKQRRNNAATFQGCITKNIINVWGPNYGVKSLHAQRTQKGRANVFAKVIQNQKMLILNKINLPEIFACSFEYECEEVFSITELLEKGEQIFGLRRVHRETKYHA